MRHFPHRHCVNSQPESRPEPWPAAPGDATHGWDPSPLGSAVDRHWVQQMQVQLNYEQSLSDLSHQLSQRISSCFDPATAPEGHKEAIAELVQLVLTTVANAMPTAAIAGLCPHPLHPHQYTVCEILTGGRPDAAPSVLPLPSWMAFQGLSTLQVGQIWSGQDLDDWRSHAPQHLWPMGDLGWLITLPGESALNYSMAWAAAPPDDRQTTFITRCLARCLDTHQQIQQILTLQHQHRQLQQAHQELTHTNQLKSEFLANTSHEIRTPLSAILGFTHILQEQADGATNPRHADYLNIILTSGQHLLALINDILDLSKVEANQLDLHWEYIHLYDICDIALTLVREKAAQKGLQLDLDIDPQVAGLIADPLRLKQMLFNLLSNAIKFTQTGSVGLRVSAGPGLPVEGWLRFTVWDTGPGIAAEQHCFLFRPYAQLPATPNPVGTESTAIEDQFSAGHDAGTGLGLALTQKLAELHGGWVEICSAVNQGTQFTIVLPAVPPGCSQRGQPPRLGWSTVPDPSASAPSASAPSASDSFSAHPTPCDPAMSTQTRTQTYSETHSATPAAMLPGAHMATIHKATVPSHLLLVEDNIHNAKLMLIYLHKLGYEVTWVQSGREMWQALERLQPALILMDVNLPETDGLVLTQQLRSHRHWQGVPIIVQTAMAMLGDREACLGAGASDYISKPLDLRKLANMIVQHLAPESSIGYHTGQNT